MAKRDPECPTVMLVNDSEKHTFMKQLLEGNGYCVLEATNAADAVEEAVDYTRRERPDLILIDLDLPQDGFHAVCLIRNGPELSRVPIVLLSDKQEPSYRAELLAAGCSACVAKPFEFDHLKYLMDGLLPHAAGVGKAIVRSAGS
jgi:CheY-like chemotaxis protein